MPRCLSGLKRLVGLDYDNAADFVTLQCTRNPTWCIFYRLVYAFYVVTVLGACTLTSGYAAKVYIFLTYWSFTMLVLSQITSFLNACTYSKPSGAPVIYGSDDLPMKFRIQWVLYNVSSSAAFVVCAMFWVVEYKGTGITFCNFNLHAINAILIVMEVFTTTTPVRFRHCIFTVLYGILYSLFALIYWLSGGTNHKGEPYIYSVLDFSNSPMKAFLYLFAASFVAPVLTQGIVLALYKIRQAYVRPRISRSQVV